MDSDGDEDGHFTIETGRLVLRRPKRADARAITALADNWHVAANLTRMPHPYREADALDWIARSSEDGAEPAYVIALAGRGTLIGACGIGPTTWTDGCQIGYWLGKPYWGRGYATEAARAMVDLAFADASLAHLWCSCRVTNDGSRGVIHKCAFQFHSAGMMYMRAAGAAVPVEHYCLDRAVWQALHVWKAA